MSLDDLRADSEAIVSSGAARYGLALDSGFDSGGGWYIEQWFAKAGEFYADNENGRAARATQVLYNNATGQSLLTFMQSMINDGLAFNVGDNPGGLDNLLKLADNAEPAAMTIATSAAIGGVLAVLAGGQFPQITNDDLGVGCDARTRRQARRAGRRRRAVGRRLRRRRAHRGVVGLRLVSHRGAAAERMVVGHRLRAGAHRRPDARPVEDHATPPTPVSRWPTTSCRRRPTRRRRSARSSGRCARSAPSRRKVSPRSSAAPTWPRPWRRGRASRRPDRRLQLPQRLAGRR